VVPSTDREGIELTDVADFLIGYRMRDNLVPGKRLPEGYAERATERLFAAAFPTTELPEVMSCARERA
jgi:hypothetical protein